MNDEADCKTAPATPGLMIALGFSQSDTLIFWEEPLQSFVYVAYSLSDDFVDHVILFLPRPYGAVET